MENLTPPVPLTERVQLQSAVIMPHAELQTAFDGSVAFNEDESPEKGDYLRGQFDDFIAATKDVPGVRGSFGTGYPFFAYKEDGGVYGVQEINRYMKETAQLVERDKSLGVGAWVCGACQVILDHPDLKQNCKPCDIPELQPRKVFQALPDLDYWVIADDEVDMETLQTDVEQAVNAIGFRSSDSDIVGSVRDINEVLNAREDGREPQARFPIDLHIVREGELRDLIQQVPGAILKNEFLGIQPVSLHKKWELADEPYDFRKDFLYSFTIGNASHVLEAELGVARRQVAAIVGPEGAEARLREWAPKEGRQLDTPGVQQALHQKIERWTA